MIFAFFVVENHLLGNTKLSFLVLWFKTYRSKSPAVYSTDRSKAVVLVLVLLFVGLWFNLRGDLF